MSNKCAVVFLCLVLANVLIIAAITLMVLSRHGRDIYKMHSESKVDEVKKESFNLQSLIRGDLLTHLRGKSTNSTTIGHTEMLSTMLSTTNSLPSTTGEQKTGIEALPWTSIYGTSEETSYFFFSAYYDDRTTTERPAVITMGYVSEKVEVVDIYCCFRYADGEMACLEEPALRKKPVCYNHPFPFIVYHYFCHMQRGDHVPISVSLSTDKNCSLDMTSDWIPVKNRNSSVVPMKKIGVCVGAPLVNDSNPDFIHDVIDFIEMSKLLGADVIVMYVNETQVSAVLLQYILHHYPDTVRMIGWKKFEKWVPFHYYGQLLITSDCHYRLMYEVEHIALFDLDEMILPAKHKNWLEMIDAISGSESISDFVFQNALFVEPKPTKPTIMCKGNITTPKYLTRFTRHICFPGYSYRVKLMFKPKLVESAFMHYVCKRVPESSKSHNVPPDLGYLGHYRAFLPKDCRNRKHHEDRTALRFEDELKSRMCPN